MVWVGVGWRRRSKTELSLRELDNRSTVFYSIWFLQSPRLLVELDIFCVGRTPRKGGDRIP